MSTKILVAFYSLTGNTKKLAQAVAVAGGGELMEIRTKNEIPNKGFIKYWVGGRQVMKKELPELAPFGKEPNDYDLIFVGTPVWAGDLVPAVRSFLAQAKLKGKRIALFCAHGGDNPGRAFIGLEKKLAGNDIVGKIDFKMDGIAAETESDNLRKIAEWAKGVAK
jgi:flavodoxin